MKLGLWKSLYSYNGDFPGSLSFRPNEFFLVLRKENEYWFLVSQNDGTLGCVPVNYIEITDFDEFEINKYVVKAIESLSQKTASIIKDRDVLLRELLDFKDNIRKESDISSINHIKNEPPKEPSVVPEGLAFELTDVIRQTTHSSHKSSLKALKHLLRALDCHIPDLKMWTKYIHEQIKNPSNYHVDSALYNSLDWRNLEHLFNYFETRKNDSQERGWSLHEDVNDLQRKLSKLLKILKKSNKELVSRYLEKTNYEYFLSLIHWYQLEQRKSLRSLLLQIFIVCNRINQLSIDVCLQSILPVEIIRDLMDKNTDKDNYLHATTLIGVLINGSQTINLEIKEKLNENLCECLLSKLLECSQPVQNDTSEQRNECGSDISDDEDDEYSLGKSVSLDDVIFTFLLTLNKLFNNINTNPVLKGLLNEPSVSQIFIEKLIMNFNRNTDPTSVMFVHAADNNSVLKVLCDIYSNRTNSEIIYSNDTDVLIDIISREICNLPANSRSLSEYLLLLDLIITNSDYLSRKQCKMFSLKQVIGNLIQTFDEKCEVNKGLSLSIAEKL